MTEGTRKRTDFLFLQKAGLTESEGPILVREEVGEKHIKPCAGAVSKKTSPAATKVMVENVSLCGSLPDPQRVIVSLVARPPGGLPLWVRVSQESCPRGLDCPGSNTHEAWLVAARSTGSAQCTSEGCRPLLIARLRRDPNRN